MTASTTTLKQISAVPGVTQPPTRDAGVWRIRARAQALVAVAQQLVSAGASVLMVAGEDRRHVSGDMRAHYLFGFPESHDLLHIEVPLDADAPTLPSLAALSFPASRFEREMQDLLGITPAHHPDPRPLVRHGFWPVTFHPLRRDAQVPDFEDDGQPFPFTRVQGEGVYEIPVGPVHAGVIEPGHFRFSVLGETILKMRARLYFTHKGTEKLFEGRSLSDGLALAERISGDTSVGHALAYCQAIEALAGTRISERAAGLRVVLLELERIYNHVTDAGAIIADTGFPVGQSHCLRVRERLLRLNRQLTGHRLLRGAIQPGGVRWQRPIDRSPVQELRQLAADFGDVLEICLANTLVRDRVEGTGRLAPEVARDFGVVGYVARACGLAHDVRRDYPCAGYAALQHEPIVETDGDVNARLLVRVREVQQSVQTIERLFERADDDALVTAIGPLPPLQPGFGLVEGWRGRIAHMVTVDDRGALYRVKVVDPSFFNWPALARALEDNIVPDFPLCNKSFNQSYSGNDV